MSRCRNKINLLYTAVLTTVIALMVATLVPSASAQTAALNPRGAFQNNLSGFLVNTFRIPATAVNLNQSSIGVNSANQAQFFEVVFNTGDTRRGRAMMRLFNNLPPSNPFPPTTTAQIPRVYLDQDGVVAYAQLAQPLLTAQRDAIANLYRVDQVSRGNYAFNLQNIASAFNRILVNGSSFLSNNEKTAINNAISSLNTSYNQLANFGGRSPDPDTVYKQATQTAALVDNNIFVSNDDLSILYGIIGIGYSNYLFNRLPINGNNNPTTTTRGALPAFNRAGQLPAAQGDPEGTFGASARAFLDSIGEAFSATRDIAYQVNSANKLQAIEVDMGSGESLTLFFNGAFPVTNQSQVQAVFEGLESITDFAFFADVPSQTQARLVTFYQNNAGPRGNYVANLNNLISGFQSILNSGSNLSSGDVSEINRIISRLQGAVRGLNSTPAIVPNVLDLYNDVARVVDNNLQSFGGFNSSLNATALAAADTINRSTLPIGYTNYFFRPIVQTLP